MVNISIIVPCFNEADNISAFTDRIAKVLVPMQETLSYELVFIDDCSTDTTVLEIKKFIKKNPQHILILNQRNYGVYRSSFSALKFANGDWVIPMMPVDSQDPPEVIHWISWDCRVGDRSHLCTRRGDPREIDAIHHVLHHLHVE